MMPRNESPTSLRLALCALTLACPSTLAAQTTTPRQVAAPASDVLRGVVRLPQPASSATTSAAAIVPVELRPARDGRWTWEQTLAVESSGVWTLSLLAPAAASWRVLVAPEGELLRPIDERAGEVRVGLAGDALAGWVIVRRDLQAVTAGRWSVRIEAREPAAVSEGWLLASAAPELSARAFVTTHELVSGARIGVAAFVPRTSAATVMSARLVLESDSTSHELRMFDDGEHEDGAASDGTFGALVPQDVLGRTRAFAELGGTTAEGFEFRRSVPLGFTVLLPRLVLDAEARAVPLDERHWSVELGATAVGPPQRLHVSAELWGHDADGRDVPVCWLSRMLDPESSGASWTLPLRFDLRWLGVSGAGAPFELRNVRVQDPDTEGVLAQAARAVCVAPRVRAVSASGAAAVTASMLAGPGAPTPAGSTPVGPYAPLGPSAVLPALMLAHGYCSSGSIWPAADFTQPKLEFLDPNANRTHDQFAQLLDQRAQTAGLSSFGVVCHSQGGPAALHLLTYYSSALDRSTGGRRIQSLASPYQGTPLASLGFFACGVNDNMTPSGATTWLAGIPTWARTQVWFWTTSNSGSACNFLTGLLLTDPEDGTVEQSRAQLPGAHSMGHTVGWCHTTGMSNPASYTDHARNQAMNAAAAR